MKTNTEGPFKHHQEHQDGILNSSQRVSMVLIGNLDLIHTQHFPCPSQVQQPPSFYFHSLHQWSPKGWGPGTSFMENNFSIDPRRGWFWENCSSSDHQAWVIFSYGVHNLDPSHSQFIIGFVLLWEANAAANLTGGEAQAVVLARLPLTSFWATWFLTGHGPVSVHGPGVGDLFFRVVFLMLLWYSI